MAAGRHGGYRENEFRERDSSLEVSRRDFATAKDDYERIRNGNRESERGSRVGDVRDRNKVSRKDVRERDRVNGEHQLPVSKSDSGSSGGGGGGDEVRHGPKRCDFSVKSVDREPGELSSESGSDEATDPVTKDTEVSKVTENGKRSSLDRKRKFSPIIWDRDDKGPSNSTKSCRPLRDVNGLPPPPPLPKVYRQSVVPDGSVHISPINDSDQNEKLGSSFSPAERSETPEPCKSDSPVVAEQEVEAELAANKPEDEDTVPTRNISSSRWAAGNSSPGDEGEILEDEITPSKRRNDVFALEPLGAGVRSKSLTPEFGEFKREGSERSRGRSSESDDRGARARSSSRDNYPEEDSDGDDYMEFEEERNQNRSNRSRSDSESEDRCDSPEIPEPPTPPQRSVNMLQGCRSVDEFERLNKIDEGTYGVVYRARDKKTGEVVALKKVKMEKEREGFPLTALREINILLSFHHPSIVDVKEVVVGSSLDSIFMVMEYMEHDLKALMETMKQPFSQSEVKCLMLQLLSGIKYLHDNWVLHRDLKTSNLLLNNCGELKICDFGLARQYGSPLKPYTHLVVTLWYRSPELLLGAKQYSTAIDMWSLGCIMAEFLSKQPLFNGKTEFDQLDKIFRTLGTPNETIWPGYSKLPGVKVNFVKHQYNLLRKKFPATSFTGSPVLSDSGFDLLNRLLTYDPERRITAEDALNHEWFREVPLPKTKEFMPTFPAQHAQDRRHRRMLKSPDPLEEQRRKELQMGELGTGGVFG